MIVRDEAPNILDTLRNLTEKIALDYWIIHDTGSLDDTAELISRFFVDKGIPGRLIQRDWESFGANRQYALEDAEGLTDHVLIFDADNQIEGTLPPLPQDFDSLTLNTQCGSLVYSTKLIIRNDGRFRWRGVVHEALYFNGKAERTQHLSGDYRVEARTAGARSRDSSTYYRDARILAEAVRNIPIGDEDLLPRYTFYCANSWRDAQVPHEAAEWYRRRIALGGWRDEVYLSWLGLGIELTKLNRADEALIAFLSGQEVCPERAECLYHLARLQRNRGQMQSALLFAGAGLKRPMPDIDRLFVWRDIYNFWLDFEYLYALKYLGCLAEGDASLDRMRIGGAPPYLYAILGLQAPS